MTEAAAIRPVFVLGIQRSGTTLAANLLAAHPEIAAVSAEAHGGVHESVFFSHFARIFGPWNDAGAREHAIASFLTSDYFRLTGLDPAWAARIEAPTAGGFFAAMMDRFAADGGRRAWVEKSPHHTLLGERIAAEIPSAAFLCVTREPLDHLRSRLWSYGRRPPPYPRRARDILRACASNAFHRHALDSFCAGRPDAFRVDYAALASDPAAALAPLARALGIAGFAGLRPAFVANSSFASSEDRARGLTAADRLVAQLSLLAVAVTPQPALARVRVRILARRPTAFPDWVWRLAASGPALTKERS